MNKLLLVDDEPGVLLTLAANLELEGFEVVTAENAERALALLAGSTFDLILSDIRMPGLSGIELFRRARALRPDVPMILMTAFFIESQIREAVTEGVFAVLPKPTEIDHVVALVRRAQRRPFVLVVDDQEPHATSLAAALSTAGVRARAVFDGPSAVGAVRAGDVDVCVTDLVMPGMDGAQVVEEVRKLAPSVAIIVFSGHAVSEMMTRVASRGVFACLRKPLDPRDLVEMISKARTRAAAAKEGR